MKNALLIIQIIISVLLVFLITIQAKGSGLSGSFGGASQSSFSRRGLEKLIYKLTFITAGIFLLISMASLVF